MNRAADRLRQPESDLTAAADSAATGHHEWCAFQAQQSAEKAAKALLQALHASVRGHGITAMLKQLPAAPPDPLLDGARELDKVYVTARYPNGLVSGAPMDYFTESTSRQLIGHARDILEFCRSRLP